MDKNSQVVVAVLVVIALIIGGYWYYSMVQKNSTPTAAMPSMTPTTSSSPKTTASPTSAKPEKNLIAISQNTFVPDMLVVKAGETVTWVNNDSYAHDVTSDDKSFVSPKLNTGDKFSFTFKKVGTFTYICSIHPFMHGTIKVTK